MPAEAALDAAFELAESLGAIICGSDAKPPALIEPSPPTRSALHWHSILAKPRRCLLRGGEVERAAVLRVNCAVDQCERYARHALEQPSTTATCGQRAGAKKETEEGEVAAEVVVREAVVGQVPASTLGTGALSSPTSSGSPLARMPSSEALSTEAADASRVATAKHAAFPLGATLWGAPLARGVPHPADYQYVVLTKLPGPLDECYTLLTSDAARGGFCELRCGTSTITSFVLANDAHPHGGTRSAEVKALRAEAKRRHESSGVVSRTRGAAGCIEPARLLGHSSRYLVFA